MGTDDEFGIPSVPSAGFNRMAQILQGRYRNLEFRVQQRTLGLEAERTRPGQVVLKLETPWRDGRTYLVMSPLEFMRQRRPISGRSGSPMPAAIGHRPLRTADRAGRRLSCRADARRRARCTGRVSFEDQRSRVMGRNQARCRSVGSGRFLGAEMLGPAAEHLGHLLPWSVRPGDTVQQMLDIPFCHPAVEEGLRTALRHLRSELRMGPVPVERCLVCGPGT